MYFRTDFFSPRLVLRVYGNVFSMSPIKSDVGISMYPPFSWEYEYGDE